MDQLGISVIKVSNERFSFLLRTGLLAAVKVFDWYVLEDQFLNFLIQNWIEYPDVPHFVYSRAIVYKITHLLEGQLYLQLHNIYKSLFINQVLLVLVIRFKYLPNIKFFKQNQLIKLLKAFDNLKFFFQNVSIKVCKFTSSLDSVFKDLL